MSESEESALYDSHYQYKKIIVDDKIGVIRRFCVPGEEINYYFYPDEPMFLDRFYEKILKRLSLLSVGFCQFIPNNKKPWYVHFGAPYFQSIEDLIEFHNKINEFLRDPNFSPQKLRDNYEREKIGVSRGR